MMPQQSYSFDDPRAGLGSHTQKRTVIGFRLGQGAFSVGLQGNDFLNGLLCFSFFPHAHPLLPLSSFCVECL